MPVNELLTKAICISSIGTKSQNAAVVQLHSQCNSCRPVNIQFHWEINNVVSHKKNIAPGQNEESKQSRDCQSAGYCWMQWMQWLPLTTSDQSFRETHLRDVWAEDETQTSLVSHQVNFLNFLSTVFTKLPPSEYNSCSPLTGYSVCAVDSGTD